jgi:DNA-binding winged helix-turn-helix (wHTH) protein
MEPREVLTKSALIDARWHGLEEGNITVQVASLRKLLGSSAPGSDWMEWPLWQALRSFPRRPL